MVVLCNGRSDLAAVDAKSGELIWSVPAGGDSSPAIANDQLAIQGRPELRLFVYELKPDIAVKRWNVPMDVLRNRSSPIIHEQSVYLIDDDVQRCLDLATGRVRWEEKISSSIASPVLADGKLFVMVNNGNNVQMIRAGAETRVELGRAVVRGTWVPSPRSRTAGCWCAQRIRYAVSTCAQPARRGPSAAAHRPEFQ